jgi:hypothetical protein
MFPLYKYCGTWGRKHGMALKYYYARGKWPNLKNPQNLSEKLLASMCEPQFLKYAELADKVKVHDYIKSKGLESILLKHYRVWDSPNQITREEIEKLPEKFILKPNNGSGGHVYCRDKKTFDLEKAKQTLQSALDRAKDYFLEPHYLKIEPKVYAEQLLDLGEGKVLTDYKFHCIKGEIVDVFLAGENAKGERKYDTVDLNWNILPYTLDSYVLEPVPSKPVCLDEMVKYAKILSKDFDFVRVDFYEYEGKVYFSELTFSPWGGYLYSYTEEALDILGKKL